jgi:NADPH-dependent curcumin reductase CurA
MLDFMLGRLNEFARIVMCGAISDYSKLLIQNTDRAPPRILHLADSAQPYPIRNYQALISTKSTMQGFIVFQFAQRYDEGREYLSKLLKDGKLKYEWSVVGDAKDKLKGVEACVDGLQGLYEGRNVGKT